jgi:hypothetical protein
MPFKSLKKAIKQKEGRSVYVKPSQSFIISESKRIRELHAQKGQNSGAPTEISSKIPVPRRRVVIPVQKKKVLCLNMSSRLIVRLM